MSTETLDILVQDPSQTSEARRAARELSKQLQYDSTAAEHVAIVATELCTNLLKHGGGGSLLISNGATDASAHELVQLLAIDRGPGMIDVEHCFRDGYTTSTSPGTGLGAVTRLSHVVDVYSMAGQGTAVLARVGPKDTPGRAPQPHTRDLAVKVAGVRVRKPGQVVCGDDWTLVDNGPLKTAVVADGLGHGPDAARASAEAVRVASKYARFRPKEMMEAIHGALRSTRGAAVAVAQIDLERGTIAFAGAGNIAASVMSASRPNQHLVSANGTAGHELRRLQEYMYPFPEDAVLLMHSDGLGTRWDLSKYPGLLSRDPALVSAILYRDFSRRSDDTTVLTVRRA